MVRDVVLMMSHFDRDGAACALKGACSAPSSSAASPRPVPRSTAEPRLSMGPRWPSRPVTAAEYWAGLAWPGLGLRCPARPDLNLSARQIGEVPELSGSNSQAGGLPSSRPPQGAAQPLCRRTAPPLTCHPSAECLEAAWPCCGLAQGRRGGAPPPPADRCTQPSRFGTRILNTKSQQETTRLKFDKLFIS